MRGEPEGAERFTAAAVLPARDEEGAIGAVLSSLAGSSAGAIHEVVVVDNGSRDGTADVARDHGATVVAEPRRGYGRACLAGIAHLTRRPADDAPDAVVFLDADGSSDPAELPRLLAPIRAGDADLSIGSRVRGRAEPGAWPLHARLGSRFAAFVIRVRSGYRFTDLGPFRAVRWDTLGALGMRDPDFGWTAEMQVRAASQGVRSAEVAVTCRKRVEGRSKVSGTFAGSFLASVKILATVFHPALPARARKAGDGPAGAGEAA